MYWMDRTRSAPLTPLRDVNVSDWSSSYDAPSSVVYMMVVAKTTPVVDLETSNNQNFSYPGWFAPAAMNRALQKIGLQPPSKMNYGGNMLTVINATSATCVFDVRTKQPVSPQDWRLVIMAIGGEHGRTKVLWTKQVAPS